MVPWFVCVCVSVVYKGLLWSLQYCAKSIEPPLISAYSAKKNGEIKDLLKSTNINANIVNHSEFNSVWAWSQYLVRLPLLFNTAWTLLGKLSCHFWNISPGFSIQVCFYCIGCVLGIIAILKNYTAANQKLSRQFYMVDQHLMVLCCVHNSINFGKIINNTD